MYTLYIANKNYSSWSLRPWLLMRQLDIRFKEVLVPFGSRDSAAAGFRSFSPTGKVPCLIDGDIRIWNSSRHRRVLVRSASFGVACGPGATCVGA